MSLLGELQRFDQSAVIELFEIDTTLRGGGISHFHAGTNEIKTGVIWQGQTYLPLPLQVTGFEMSGTTFPRPKLSLANISGVFSTVVRQFNDLVGCKVTRKRTLAMYLDAANFTDGNPTANPNEHFNDDIFYVVRKTGENKVAIEFELGSSLDLQGVMLPKRQIIAGTCSWLYRGEECGYTGVPVAKSNDEVTTVLSEDMCSKTVKGCKLRFGENGDLRGSFFPGAGLVDI